MSTVNISERANNQTITITLASLANNGQRSCLAVDNSTNLDLDELVQVIIATGASGFAAGGYVNIYAYASADGGTTYPEGAGTDTGVTLTFPPNVRLIGRINTPANSTTYKSEPMSVAAAFAGTMPTRWGIIIENKGGGALASTGNAAFYAGMQATVGGSGGSGSAAPFNDMLAPTAVTPPLLGALTWGNQGTATAVANAGGAIYMSGLGTGSDNLKLLYRTPPPAPWSLTIGLVPGSTSVGTWNLGGLVLRESATGKLIGFWTGTNASGLPTLIIEKYSGYVGSPVAGYFNVPTWPGLVMWLKVTNDGTNLTWYTSIDGQNFKQQLQKSVTDYFTTGPDEAGIAIDTINATVNTDAVFVHWAGI